MLKYGSTLMWDALPSNHTFWLLSKHSCFSLLGHILWMPDKTCQKDLKSFSLGELEEITRTPLYYVDEDYPPGPEIQ